jgi:hypothetical protein
MNSVVLYGGFPPEDASPRISEDERPVAAHPDPWLVPCAACKRHIRTGTDCPFCFATALAAANKPPTRAADDRALGKAHAALIATDNALGTLRAAREQLCTVIHALEEASK